MRRMQYRAIVFRQLPASPDFSCSTQTELPGQHTEAAAWGAVHAAMQSGGEVIGGEVVPVFAESNAERDAEMLRKT